MSGWEPGLIYHSNNDLLNAVLSIIFSDNKPALEQYPLQAYFLYSKL